jgi:hypothetical protein
VSHGPGCASRPRIHHDRKSAFRQRHAGTPGKSGRECLCHEGQCGAGTGDKRANSGLAACSSVWPPRRLAGNRRPKRPDGTPERDPGPFNAHSPDGRGSGLVQHVLRSPARIPAVESSRRDLCAAPASVKRCTLSRVSGERRKKIDGSWEFCVTGAKVRAALHFSLAPIRRCRLSASCATATRPFRAKPSGA